MSKFFTPRAVAAVGRGGLLSAVAPLHHRGILPLCLAVVFASSASAQLGGDNPTGTSGAFNGAVTTGGSYDPYTGNVTRTITDISVAGSVGAYPLAFTRTLNSRYATSRPIEFGPGGTWSHNYQWRVLPSTVARYGWDGGWDAMPTGYVVEYPDGRRVSFSASAADDAFRGPAGWGISDRFQPVDNSDGGDCYLLLPDGGMIHFKATVSRTVSGQEWITSTWSYRFAGIFDPHGLYTSVTYPADGSITITEPAKRQLKIFYNGSLVDRVEERADRDAPTRRSVKYNYAAHGSFTVLTSVVYFNDATLTATYTYRNSNVAGGRPLLLTATDPMYAGPMWQIAYEYAASNVHGQILREKHRTAPTSRLSASAATAAPRPAATARRAASITAAENWPAGPTSTTSAPTNTTTATATSPKWSTPEATARPPTASRSSARTSSPPIRTKPRAPIPIRRATRTSCSIPAMSGARPPISPATGTTV